MHFTHSPVGLCCEAHLLWTFSAPACRWPRGLGNGFSPTPRGLACGLQCLPCGWPYNLSVCHPSPRVSILLLLLPVNLCPQFSVKVGNDLCQSISVELNVLQAKHYRE